MHIDVVGNAVQFFQPLVEIIEPNRFPIAITTLVRACRARMAAIWASLFLPFHSFSIRAKRKTELSFP